MNPALWAILIFVILSMLAAVWVSVVKVVVVRETQQALLSRNGKFVRLLGPGKHRLFGGGHTIDVVDMRSRSELVGNQEVTTRDGVPVKVSLIVRYTVADPLVFRTRALEPVTDLHHFVQAALRDSIAELPSEELIENRSNLSSQITERTQAMALAIGISVTDILVRDVIFGGGIKTAMADIVRAQFEGRAALERARSEAATMRSMANTARMLDENPNLAQLRLLQAIESGKATVVIGADASFKLPVK